MPRRELEEQMSSFAAGLAHLGLRRGDKVSLFSEKQRALADRGSGRHDEWRS